MTKLDFGGIMGIRRFRQMTTVDFSFNSETNEKLLLIDGIPKKFDKCWGNGDKAINEWGNTFFPSLCSICNDTDIQLNVSCDKTNYDFIEKLLGDFKSSNTKVNITISEVNEKYIKEKLKVLTPTETKNNDNIQDTITDEEIKQEKQKKALNDKEDSIRTEPKKKMIEPKKIKNPRNYRIDLIIVYDKFTADIAQQLNAIMSTIPECQSRVLSETDWNGIKTQITSEEYVLFLGNVKDGLALKPLIQWKFEKLNMKYGWVGKKTLMLVEKHTFNKEELEELKSMFENQEIKYMNAWIIRIITIISAILISPIGFVTTGILATINKKNADSIYKAEFGYMINMLCDIRKTDFDTFIGYDCEDLLEEKN